MSHDMSHDAPSRSLAESVEGTSRQNFGLTDWGQLAATALVFGSAFLWIALALRSLSPGIVGFGRVALGGATVALIPAARCAVAKRDWSRFALAALFGQAGPALLFALAEQRIPSAVAGMLIAGVPIATAIVTAFFTRTLPSPTRVAGLAIGLVGIFLLTLPSLTSLGAETVGVLMVIVAVAAYAVAANLFAPLQQTYGALPTNMWLLIISSVMLLPFGIAGLSDSSFEWLPVVALLILGIIGTGIVWTLFVAIIGRVGAVRAAIVGYMVPIVALLLGVLVLDESVEPVQVVGVVVALLGGYLVSRFRSQ